MWLAYSVKGKIDMNDDIVMKLREAESLNALEPNDTYKISRMHAVKDVRCVAADLLRVIAVGGTVEKEWLIGCANELDDMERQSRGMDNMMQDYKVGDRIFYVLNVGDERDEGDCYRTGDTLFVSPRAYDAVVRGLPTEENQ